MCSNIPPLSDILINLAAIPNTLNFLTENHSFRPKRATDITLGANSDWKWFPGEQLGSKGCLGVMSNVQFLPLEDSILNPH